MGAGGGNLLAYTRSRGGMRVNGLGAGDFIAWVTGLLTAPLGGVVWPALPVAYLAYGLIVAGVLTLTRKLWRISADRWLALRRPLRHLWKTYRRRPRIAWSLSWRLFRKSAWPIAPLVSAGQSVLWGVAVWAAVVPWQDRGFRAAVGQLSPSLFGQSLDANLMLDGAWLTWSWTALIAWLLLLSTYRQVKARSARRRWLLGLMPPAGSGLPALGACIGLGVLVWLLSGWIPNLQLPWLVTILGCMLLPAQWAAWRQDRRRHAIGVRIPDWVWRPPVPARAPAQPRPHLDRTKLMPAVDAGPPAAQHPAPQVYARTAMYAPSAHAPSAQPAHLAAAVPAAAPPVAAAALAPTVVAAPPPVVATTARPAHVVPAPARTKRRRTVVADIPGTWAALAPRPLDLAEHEPRRIASYRILGRIGSGGMANVYLAETPRGNQIALKVTNPLTTIADANLRMLAEIRTLARVADPAVVEIHDAGMIGDQPYLAMDYLRGPTLHAAVGSFGPLSARALRSLGTTLASGLAAVHQVGVHRDVKPANIILTDSGPVIVDLGIAKLRDMTADLTQAGTTLGTIGYTAPEVLYGDDATAASDVFAWGACLAFAGSGKPLFGAGSLEVQLEAVRGGHRDTAVMAALTGRDERVAQWVARATAPSPLVRPTSGAELLELLPPNSGWPPPPHAF